MNNLTSATLLKKIRIYIIVFVIGLILSGITAFPIETLLKLLMDNIHFIPTFYQEWLNSVYNAVHETNIKYPFLSYGTDWLAFAHLVIAVAFFGPYKNPVKNIWVIQFGMIACIMVIPLAVIAGEIREIPYYHRIIDCAFGVFGFIPLYICYKNIRKLELNG